MELKSGPSPDPSRAARSNCRFRSVDSESSCRAGRLVERHCSSLPRPELQSAVFEYIEAFYNRQCGHSTLKMLSPVAYEQLRRSPLGS
jgi:transposase InsO family protein